MSIDPSTTNIRECTKELIWEVTSRWRRSTGEPGLTGSHGHTTTAKHRATTAENDPKASRTECLHLRTERRHTKTSRRAETGSD